MKNLEGNIFIVPLTSQLFCTEQPTTLERELFPSQQPLCADNKVNEQSKFISGRGENIVRKGENAGYHQVFLFLQCFSKNVFYKVVKSCDCEVRLTHYHTIPTLKHLWKRRILKTLWETEKMLVTSIFSFSRNFFYSSQHKSQFLSRHYFVVCKCFEFEPFPKQALV